MSSSQSTQHPAKRQSRLLPAPDNGSSSDQKIGPIIDEKHLVPKRPRIGVVVACDRCRLKKIRCDGGKPLCTACFRKGLEQCHYEEPSAKDKHAGFLQEGIRLLLSMEPSSASSALLAVGDLERDTEIIDKLRDVASTTSLQTAYGTGPATGFARFLERKHQFSYPILAPTSPREPGDSLRRLLAPTTGARTSRKNMPPEPIDIEESSAQTLTASSEANFSPAQVPHEGALNGLDMRRWTTVPVSDDFAARAISLYLRTDHLLLCPFNQDLFLKSLVSPEQDPYCTPCLVNALMYWCCQVLAPVEQEATKLGELFRQEAEKLRKANAQAPTALQMATEMFLSLGDLFQGKDDATFGHLSGATLIGVNLCLFGVPEDIAWAALSRATPEEVQANMYPTWGAFNWIVLMSLFFRQQGIIYPEDPPVMPIPSSVTGPPNSEELEDDYIERGHLPAENEPEQDVLFRSLCQFWRIMHEVTSVYHENRARFVQGTMSLQFAEYKYRELLAWADTLPQNLSRSNDGADIVVILHLWLHSAILDIFRPFLRNDITFESQKRLKTFATADATPDSAYNASVEQLKQLILSNTAEAGSSSYNIIWQTALLFSANAMLRSKDEDRLEYFLLCLYSFRATRHCFRVTVSIAQAILSTAMQQGEISGTLASMIIADLRARAPEGQEPGEKGAPAPSLAELDSVVLEPQLATEHLADGSNDSIWISRYNLLFQGVEFPQRPKAEPAVDE